MTLFKKLRNKFLIFNIIGSLSILVIVFTAVFSITYGNLVSDIKMQIEKTLSDPINSSNFENNNFINDNRQQIQNNDLPSISFWVEIDKNKNLVSWQQLRFAYLTEDKIQTMVDRVSFSSDIQFFQNETNSWGYQVFESNGIYRVVFIDITNSFNFLKSLLTSFIITALIALCVIFFISWKFAEKAIEPVQSAHKKQKEFISNASHELKTPLTIMSANMDVALSNPEEKVEDVQKWLNLSKSEIKRMSVLIQDLLTLAKMDDGESQKLMHSFSLSELLYETILPMEAVAFEREITLQTTIEEDISISGVPSEIAQLITILLDNAIKYSYNNQEVEVILERKSKSIDLAIRNVGPEIPKEKEDKLFERFYRLDEDHNSATGGVGLGLSIASQIVKQHHATLSITTKEEKKTTALVSFKLQ
ncbi:MAG: sensor histidine kinase [Anaerorhabdus sp.]